MLAASAEEVERAGGGGGGYDWEVTLYPGVESDWEGSML